MTQKRSCSLTSGFIILAVVATLGTANAASPPRSSTTGANDTQLAQGQPVYNYYNYPAEPVERPGCYLPSDGCLSEYSVQN
jgi:hypothetical protein